MGAAKVACSAMTKVCNDLGASQQPEFDAAQEALSRTATNARRMVLDRVGTETAVLTMPKESLNGPFQTDHALGGTRRCGKTTATIRLAKSLAEKGHGAVVVFPSNRAAAAYAEAAKPAVTAGPGEERRQGFDVVLFDHSWYEQAIASERQKHADSAAKIWADGVHSALRVTQMKREPVPVTRPPCTNAGDLLELAWGVIANVSGGDWQLQSPEWHGAAIAWREDWFRWLESRRGGLVDSAIRKVAGDPPHPLVRDPATGALGVKVGIVRDPVTGWTFDKFRARAGGRARHREGQRRVVHRSHEPSGRGEGWRVAEI